MNIIPQRFIRTENRRIIKHIQTFGFIETCYKWKTNTNHSIQDEPFLLCSTMKGGLTSWPLPNICYKYPAKMEPITVIPHLRRIQKMYNHVTPPSSSADISSFCKKLAIFLVLGNKSKNSFSCTFFWYFCLLSSLIGCFNRHGCNFDDVSEIDYSRLPCNKDILK